MNIVIRTAVLTIVGLVVPSLAAASGYRVFKGDSGVGRANAVVAHTTGSSSSISTLH